MAHLSGVAIEGLALLGARVRAARLRKRWSVEELARRAGVSPVTMRKVERGDPTVAVGTAFEAAFLVGVPLFDEDRRGRRRELSRVRDELALLPATARPLAPVDDDF